MTDGREVGMLDRMSDAHYPDMGDRANVISGTGILCALCGDEVKRDFRAYQLALTDNTIKSFCDSEQAELWKSMHPEVNG